MLLSFLFKQKYNIFYIMLHEYSIKYVVYNIRIKELKCAALLGRYIGFLSG